MLKTPDPALSARSYIEVLQKSGAGPDLSQANHARRRKRSPDTYLSNFVFVVLWRAIQLVFVGINNTSRISPASQVDAVPWQADSIEVSVISLALETL